VTIQNSLGSEKAKKMDLEKEINIIENRFEKLKPQIEKIQPKSTLESNRIDFLNKHNKIEKNLIIAKRVLKEAIDNREQLSVEVSERELEENYKEFLEKIIVRLEGLFITRSKKLLNNQPLISRAALNRLEIFFCTLDPGGFERKNGSRQKIFAPSLQLDKSYGFKNKQKEGREDKNEDEIRLFNQIPEIVIAKSISGPLFIDSNYSLQLIYSIIDAGKGVTHLNIEEALKNVKKGRKNILYFQNALLSIKNIISNEQIKIEQLIENINSLENKMQNLESDLAEESDGQKIKKLQIKLIIIREQIDKKKKELTQANYRLLVLEIRRRNKLRGNLTEEEKKLSKLEPKLVDIESETAKGFALTGVPIDGKVNHEWGPPTDFLGTTIFGQTHTRELNGSGGIFIHPVKVQIKTIGCIKFSYISGSGIDIPQQQGCLFSNQADPPLGFVSERFEQPAYGQLAHNIDFRIKERGPNDNAMGAYGDLLEADKWRNLKIRFREYMPVGIKPILITVT
ncbi:MAG: hypothetical protein ACXAC7_16550, partial [Candidatus Hodarchaeales archaeon]